jgi:beta-glucosidase
VVAELAGSGRWDELNNRFFQTMTFFVFFSMALLMQNQVFSANPPLAYQDPSAPVESRVKDLLGRLTSEEKIMMLGGKDFTTAPVERLGIPAFLMADASMGVRGHGKSTAYANGIALAATWDVPLALQVGESLGRDCRARGIHILLGPGMNLYRSPTCGRNFEYMGEDPYLAGSLAAAFISGVQSQGVAATAKHFLCNEQEVDRHKISSTIDERTLRELYLKPFSMAVDSGVRCVMSSYNPVNEVHASENELLLKQLLKKELGFQGFVMSDWNSCYDAKGMANAGLDLEMPRGVYFNTKNLLPLLKEGKVTQEVLDDKIRRQLGVAFSMGWFDRAQEDKTIPKDPPQNSDIALKEARESVTLLKNQRGLLPLDSGKIKKIVLLGHNADPAVYGGFGSSIVDPFYTTSVCEGVRKILGNEARVTLVPWKRSIPQTAKDRPPALDANGAENSPPIPAEFVDAVKQADAVIVCVGFSQSPPRYVGARTEKFDQEGEESDRPYTLPPGQEQTIREARKLNPRTIVVLNAGGSVATKGWIDEIPALLHAYYPGQSGGEAVAEILFGSVNPSGKLPFSWEKRLEDLAAYGHYPTWGEKSLNNDYQEGVFLGYRWFDVKGIKSLFPFGFGLSYTTFEFSDLKVVPSGDKEGSFIASISVKNTGGREGAEVVQLYVEPPVANVPRPIRELRGFARVVLKPGERREVKIPFSRRDLAYWNPTPGGWTVTPGLYTAAAGSSSEDLPLHVGFEIPERH